MDIRPAPTAESAEGRASAFPALRHRNFRIFYIGHVLSLGGTWLQITALGWLVLELTNSEFWLGVATAGTTAPVLFFSLFAGVVADRIDKRTILIIAQSVAFVQALTLAILTHFELATIESILILAVVLGMVNAFEIPTRQSFFAELVGREDLTSAIALNSAAFNGSRMVGPAVAGAVIGAVGVAACFYGNAFSYLFVIAGLFAIRRVRPARVTTPLSTFGDINEGFRWIWDEPIARWVVALVALTAVFLLPYTMLLPVFARDLLDVGPEGLGWLYSATGAGALIGGLTVTMVAQRVPRGKLLLGSGMAMAIFVGGFGLSSNFLLSLALLAPAGFFMILSTATANSLLQSLVPDALRGRVMSVYVVMFIGMAPIGSLLAGSLAGLIGAPATLAGGAVILLVILTNQLVRPTQLSLFV